MPKATYDADDFVFVDDMFTKYNPSAFLPRNEARLRPLKIGIPANQIAPLLARYSVTKLDANPPQPEGNPIQEPSIPGVSDRSALAPVV